jgi:hypothetical protein
MFSFSHQLSIDLEASPATVWSVIADYRRDPEWREGVRITVEPAGLVRDGSTTHEQLRMLGTWQTTIAHIRDVEPGRTFCFVSEDGKVEGTRTIEPAPWGSRLIVRLRVAVPLLLAPLAPLLGWFFRRRVLRDLARLARVVTA